MLLTLATIAFGFLGYAQAHGNHEHHEQQPVTVSPDADWATKHMAEEHHIATYDAGSFFNLHDFDSNNEWSAEEIIQTYGLRHESNNHVSEENKQKAAKTVIELYDRDGSGTISFGEFTHGDAEGVKLPDLGFGSGRHWDYETDYEIHHFEKFHGPDTKLEDLTHPEDIEHFRYHEELEARQKKQDQMDHMAIVEANIPMKFRRNN